MKNIKSIIFATILITVVIINPFMGFAEDSEVYSIQMGVFTNESSAVKLVEKINSSGLDGFYIQKSKYVVYAGLFLDRSSAVKSLTKAKSIIKDAYIVKINSKSVPSSRSADTQGTSSPNSKDNTDASKSIISDSISDSGTGSSTDELSTTSQSETAFDKIDLNKTDGLKAYNQLLGNDVLLQGVYGQSSFYFTIDSTWTLSETGYFDIYYQHSYTGENRGSSITIELNGTPIESFFVDMLDANEHYVRIPIPSKLISTGFNELKVKTYHRITDIVCEDDGNPANWVTIFGQSFIHLEYDDLIKDIDLGYYPYPYIKSYEDEPFDAKFLFSDGSKPSESIIKTAMTIASDAGKRVKFKNINFAFGDINNLSTNTNYIYIGTEIPVELIKYFDMELEDEIYIAQGSINENYKILALISKDETNLPLLANGLANDIWKDQLQGKYSVFSPDDLVFTYETPDQDVFTLSELGYASTTLTGAKTSSTQYYLEIPDNWTLEKDSSIILKVRYSKVIDFSNSSISVVINDVPVGSNILKEDGADGDIISFKIPEELKNSKTFAISVNLYLDGDFDCQDGSVNTNYWLFISNESTIYLPHVPKLKYNLFHYPAPFVSDFKMNGMNIVLDKDYSLSDVEMALNIIGYTAHEVKYISVPNLTIGQPLAEHHNILIGSIDSDVIRSNMSDFNIPYLYDKNQFESIDQRRLINPFNENLSTIQLRQDSNSPYLSMFITYRGNSYYKWITPYLSDLGFTSKLGGNTIFVDQNGYYQIFDTEPTTEKTDINLISEIDTSQSKRASYENSRNFLIFLAMLLIVVVVIIIYIASKSKKNF